MDIEEIKALQHALADAREQGRADAARELAAKPEPAPRAVLPGYIGTPEQLPPLAAALAAARAEFGPIEKNREVEVTGTDKNGRPIRYRFRYAELHVIEAAVTPALSKHGLSLLMPYSGGPHTGGQAAAVLLHADGGAMVSKSEVDGFEKIQGFGTELSYVQRYLVSKLLCLATDSDSDDTTDVGEAVSRPKGTTAAQHAAAQRQAPPKADPPKVDPRQTQIPGADRKPPAPALAAPPRSEAPPPPNDDDAPPEAAAEVPAVPAVHRDAPATPETRAAVRGAIVAYSKAHRDDFPGLVGPELLSAISVAMVGRKPPELSTEGDFRDLLDALRAKG